jgi:hypothetical protein
MQHLVGKEVFIIQGAMKSYRGTLQSLSRDTCKVAFQGRIEEFPRTYVIRLEIILFCRFDTHAHDAAGKEFSLMVLACLRISNRNSTI